MISSGIENTRMLGSTKTMIVIAAARMMRPLSGSQAIALMTAFYGCWSNSWSYWDWVCLGSGT